MGGARQPTQLVVANGKKHLGKAEIEERMASEVKAPSDNVKPPSYLTPAQKREFNKIAKQLVSIGIMANVDADTLARYLSARDEYIRQTEQLSKIPHARNSLAIMNSVSVLQNRAFNQSRSCAIDLGMTISSRCKLVVPKVERDEAEDKLTDMMDRRLRLVQPRER